MGEPERYGGMDGEIVAIDECVPFTQEHSDAIRKRILSRDSANTPWFRFIADCQILIERRAYRRRQQRLAKHKTCRRFDRRVR